MKLPISWLNDYVEIDLPLPELARVLTLAGLEVEEIRYVGWQPPEDESIQETKITGFGWDPEKIVVGAVLEVMPHPNADRLVLCRLDDGERIHTVLTGAPNLFPYLGQGELDPPLKVAYAREGARIVDAYSEGPGTEYTVLERRKIRGVESYSMACSEKELGISESHEGIILLDEDAPTGESLAEYMGDAVFDIAITPNIARAANVVGIARETAAVTGAPFRFPSLEVEMTGPPVEDYAAVRIEDPELNPRFVAGMISGIERKPSPYWVQRRLKLAGIRPIDNVVDATNYTMLELGEPLHAFDYEVLKQRAGEQKPTIITRRAEQGETLTTLDDVERELDDFSVLVTDTQGPLSIAGVMGGAETEVGEQTDTVLLEGAAWNYINIRRTAKAQRLSSEASYRFERGVHPALASQGVRRCLEWLRKWTGGTVADGLIDEYPLPPDDPVVELTPEEVQHWLGIKLEPEAAAELLRRLEFEVEVKGQSLTVRTPPHRLDIGEGVVGKADLLEELARMYGYDRIPETRLADELPAQTGNPALELEAWIRDLLVRSGLQEVVTYRMTTPEAEARSYPQGKAPEPGSYLKLRNPITDERTVLRRSLLGGVLEIAENNHRVRERMALFEIGPEFIPEDGQDGLPLERTRLAVVLTGPRTGPHWQGGRADPYDYYDLKGILESVFEELHLDQVQFTPAEDPRFHPGKCARVLAGEQELGVLGEIHPLVKENYSLPDTPLVMGEFRLDPLLSLVDPLYELEPIPNQPPVLEDLAVVVDEDLSAAEIAGLIREAAGELLSGVRLFDVYHGEQVEEGKKSLAYNLVYQHPERTLTDEDVHELREHILERLEEEVGGYLRR
jgi:phenylalanyl-tRNA synthetase beta chain